MRILAIIAHDKETSLSKTIFNHAVTFLSKQENIELDILDLYSRAEEIPFYSSNRAQLEANAFYQENKERILKADRLLIVFPTYWYSTPGILKCWFDLINQFAWKFNGPYKSAIPLHQIKKALVINLTITPRWYNLLWLGDPARDQVKKTLQFLGIEPMMYTVDRSINLSQSALEKHIKNITRLCKMLLT
ncbi:MAG TPA: NAD(P)H-dependent oxidoreductase [Candidatus Babeliales bacterium]|nr:NAD(P)H-dependent oxidoreductase [Candidatus Babeliales bacterium]